ncbi:hypothetical protein BDR07DRAFT_1482976 [Suillus spraguei]|nr:hypothetical protein BDR07DRAFT_1482976 [Suillus spraguei]
MLIQSSTPPLFQSLDHQIYPILSSSGSSFPLELHSYPALDFVQQSIFHPSPCDLLTLQYNHPQETRLLIQGDEHNGSKDEDDKDFVKTKGRLPQASISKAQELGKKMLEATRVLSKEYEKSARIILIEAWFAAACPPPKGASGAVFLADLKAWMVKQ